MIRLLLLLLALASGSAHAASPDDLLEPEKAFRISARALDARTAEVSFVIADGYYMYRDKFRFAAEPGAKLGAAEFPAGERKKDEFFGEVETYRKRVAIRLPVESTDGTLRLKVISQGCADAGVCYVPMDSQVSLRLAAFTGGTGASQSSTFSGLVELAGRASDLEMAHLFESGSLALVLASFLGLGLLLAFTPCVLPMIPILSGIIAGEGANIGKRRAFLLSLAYVLGMAGTYAAAGVVAGWSGTYIVAALQNAWVLLTFALVFVVLALSMFGLYELQLPGFLRLRLQSAQGRLTGGRVGSVAAMGAFSALIVSPCVAAPLAGALLYIGQTRDVALGGAALFVMALGMGVPLIAVGVSGGALLPRSGPWMRHVLRFFGALLLGVAVWVAWPVIGPAISPAKEGTHFVRVDSVAQLEEKLRAPGRPVLLDFYADWCVSCKEMEAFTFSDPRVKAKLERMLLLQTDVTANSDAHKELLKRFRLFGPPGIIFFDESGKEIRGLRVIGYQNAERFLKSLELLSGPGA
ncbi:MAG: protein-disulfide reductase DsbD [Proteobacteria bacterium]|nr:protein-disulfide reductase DsbD [Pseudomonadota bacterium]MDA0983112.1 protein-disulfide reductase DsbD [Pseudomonadota bacterium]